MGMQFRHYKTVQITETLGIAVNETESKMQIMVAPSSPFGGGHEVMLTFEEFKQVVSAMQLLEIERTIFKKPRKKKEE